MKQNGLPQEQSSAASALRLRPTLLIGLGGTGHRVVVLLKAISLLVWGRERVERLFKFLVFDTAQEALTTNLGQGVISLEPGSEFVDIGQTPVPNIKRNLERQSAIQERLGGVIANLPPTVLRNGAKQLRPLGLLAFLWRYTEVETRLREAIWALAGRQRTEGREGINVFVINSLVGGTGSSTYLDVAHLVRDLFDELGSLGDFCYLTGVGVLPQAFHGIAGPNLIPNTVASLKELNHCMLRGNFNARYPTGRTITTAQPPFNIYYLIDGVDERGHTWRGPHEVCRLAAEAIFLQMGSQVGLKNENDFDNLDEVLSRQTEDGEGTFCGSFGLASLYFSGPVVAQVCAARQAVRLIEQGLLAPLPDAPPTEVEQWVNDLLEIAGLEPARLAEHLARDDQGTPLSIELAVPGWAARLTPQAAPAELVRYVRDYERARLGSDFKRWLDQNETRITAASQETLTNTVARLAREQGLPLTEAFLLALSAWLERTAVQLSSRQAEGEGQIAALTRDLAHQETLYFQAGEGFFIGRGQRVARAQQAYFSTAHRLYSLRWQAQLTAATLAIFNRLGLAVRDAVAASQAATIRLQAAGRALKIAGSDFESSVSTGVTTQILADEKLVTLLFDRHTEPVGATVAALFNGSTSPLDWREAAVEEIEAALLTACRPTFAAIAALSVEDALLLRIDQASPEGFYRGLLEQATPSWNLDRTRLPDGGAGLQRLAVLGVPDESSSIFRAHASMLVSTGDRTRVTMFVAHVGAAHRAIQQWSSYQAAYDQLRGRVPLHILPQFQADNEQARRAFALGLVFQFITHQGAYFYYIPADPLARPIKLAQGWSNALQAFIKQDLLVRETWERIEQGVASRGIEATLRTLSTYYNTGNGAIPTDDLILELKRLVRAYADELRQIHQFAGLNWTVAEDHQAGAESIQNGIS